MLTLYIADVERDVGMKNLSRKEAAKVLEDMKVKIEIPKAAVTQWKRNTALDMAIEALKYSGVPNSSDCISRKAAISEIMEDLEDRSLHDDPATPEDYAEGYDEGIRNAATIVLQMPPAQPEIIRCKDCKHFVREGMYCSCDIIDRFDHFYCYYAERKEDD